MRSESLQAHVGPVLAAVGRLVDAVADRDAVARPRLAGADPDVFGFFGSMATAPIDCTGCLSKTGLKVVPPFTDFQTPPLAAPT